MLYGPLTRSGAAELTTSLPAIRLLGEAERDQVWRLTAGHPLAMEYLDLVLARGERYQDLASRIAAAIRAGTDMSRTEPTEPTELPEATAEQISGAACDLMFGELFGRLGVAARSLLVRASVFRVPVTAEALGARPGPIAECEAAGLLGSGAGDPLGSAVVVETAAVRSIFGGRLAGVYAPEVLASFGTGATRVDVRIVAPDGIAAYRRALAADIRARRAAGVQLLRDPRITVTPAARAALAAGQVDARLLITLAALAAGEPVRVDRFGGRAPGESPGLALRTAEITAPAATARRMLAFVRAQRSPYLATRAGLTPGPYGYLLTIEFGAPAPLGMLR